MGYSLWDVKPGHRHPALKKPVEPIGGGLDISTVMQQLMSALGLPQNIAENIYKKSAGVIGRTAGETRGRLHQAALSSGLTDTPTTIPGIANIGKRETELKGEAMGAATGEEARIKAGLMPAFLSLFAQFAQMGQRGEEFGALAKERKEARLSAERERRRRRTDKQRLGRVLGLGGVKVQPTRPRRVPGGGLGGAPIFTGPGPQTAMSRASAAESRRAKEARQRYRQSKETHKEAMRTSRRARKIRKEKARKTFWD
jgi:hypothetical protein